MSVRKDKNFDAWAAHKPKPDDRWLFCPECEAMIWYRPNGGKPVAIRCPVCKANFTVASRKSISIAWIVLALAVLVVFYLLKSCGG